MYSIFKCNLSQFNYVVHFIVLTSKIIYAMKNQLYLFLLLNLSLTVRAQTAITAVSTSSAIAPSSNSYTITPNTYNWGVSTNNSVISINGFTASGLPYTYAATLNGTVKLRRVNNALTSGVFSLMWAEVVNGTNVFNMFPEYQSDMELFFDNRVYNKGTDNFFDNTSGNSNNIERLDWILPSAYSTPFPDKIGFAVFERGAVGGHDPFCIAAVTAVDGFGNPTAYSNIVRVSAANYGDPGPNVTYRILKGLPPANLADAGTSTQGRGGVIISLQDLGVAANASIYGYSLFSNDLPVAATPANLVVFTNTTYFPINTGNPGGIDLVAVTGIYIANSVLPVRFTNFNAVENNGNVNLKWTTENEINISRYEIERSTDGVHYFKINELHQTNTAAITNNYSITDNIIALSEKNIYYRIKQLDLNGAFYYSTILTVKKNSRLNALNVYPIPAQNDLNISIYTILNNKASITVFNAAGAQVLQQQIQTTTGNNFFRLDGIEKLVKGVYTVAFKYAAGNTETKQFVKQ